MRITYLHQYFTTPDMAGGTRSYEMARRLVASGHEVNLVTSWRNVGRGTKWFVTEEAGIRVHWLPVPYSNHMAFKERLSAFIRFAVAAALRASRIQSDVVFATSTPLTIALPAVLASRRLSVPMVFEVRDMWPDVPIALGVLRNPVMIVAARIVERLAYRSATRLVALAPGMRDDIALRGIDPAKIAVIPNGCDLDVFGVADRASDPRIANAWLGSRPLLVYAGAIGAANGVDYLVHVAAHLGRIAPEVCCVVIGAGAKRAEVRELASKVGVLGKNFFLIDSMPKREVAAWLRAADLHAALMRGPRSYTKNAVNNKFFDALACERPIMNNFEGWQAAIAEDNDVGFTVDPVDHASAAHRIVRVLQDREWLSRVPERALRLAEGPFNRDRLASQLEQVLLDALMSSGPRSGDPSGQS